MIVIPPITITDSILDTSNVAENDYAEYNPATAYSIGNQVMVSTVEPNVHRNYECLIANTGETPWTNPVDGSGDPYWLDLGPTNRWAMFDDGYSTQTENADTIEVEITPGEAINGIAFLNLAANSVQVIVTDPTDGEVYNETFSTIDNQDIVNWWQYYFNPIERRVDLAILDLPGAYPDASIEVIVDNTGGTAKVGSVLYGFQVTLGTADFGTNTGIKDYSIKEQDSFGNFVIVERSFSKRANYAVTVDTGRVGYVQNFLAGIRATPVVYVGSNDYGSTIVYGYYRDFDIVISSPPISQCTLRVEGLT